MALVLVGAVFVGCIETLWAGTVRGHRSKVSWWNYPGAHAPFLARGQEMGRFNMGSTVIALFADDAVRLSQSLHSGAPIHMGQSIGTLTA